MLALASQPLLSIGDTAMIGRLGPRFASRGRTKGTVVMAMPAGERHDLGLAMLGDILRSDGYRVLNLGADTPGPALVARLREVDDLSALALSVVNGESLTAASSLIDAVRQSIGAVPVLAGGAAVRDEQSAQRLGADAWAGDAREVGPIISALAATRGKP